LAAQNVYECMIIFDSNRYARDPGGVSGQLNEMVNKCGGEVLASRLWNEQKLAYPIKGHKKGTYWLSYFRMETPKLVEFNRACQLNENIMRKLVLKVEPRLVEALVAHALGKAQIKRPDGVMEQSAPVARGADIPEGVDLGN
jgi:small subunit ribosomal protein S6